MDSQQTERGCIIVAYEVAVMGSLASLAESPYTPSPCPAHLCSFLLPMCVLMGPGWISADACSLHAALKSLH